MGGAAAVQADFFISRTGADAEMAKLIAGIVRDAGGTAFYQNEHFGHADFMRRMEQGYESGARMIALLSPEYQQSEYCRAEYNHVLSQHKDPSNLQRTGLIVLRVADCAPAGNLQNLAYTDLVPLLTDIAALTRVVRVAIGADTRASEVDFAKLHIRAGEQIRHPAIRAVPDFTGREDLLASLDAKLWRGGGKVALSNSSETPVALRGFGGVGKTVLAQEYAWRNRTRYHGVWWIGAATPETLTGDLAALGARLIPGLGALEPEKAARITLDRLAQMHTDKPWLLIYDNVDSLAALRGWTPAANAHVLITTRVNGWYGEADELAVDVFERETAIAFLLAHARHADGRRGRLAEALGRLPLALAHARAYCRERNWTFDAYAALLPELIHRSPKHAAYPASVFATFSLAIARAEEECAEAGRLMELLAFFAPERVPLWLIPKAVLPPLALGDAVAALGAVSLVEPDSLPGGEPSASVHRLVQEVVRERLREAGWFEAAAAEAVRLAFDGYDEDSDTFATQERRVHWLPHALAVLAQAPRQGEAARLTWGVCIYAGEFRVTRGELGAALASYRSGLDIAEGLAKADPGNTGWQRDLSVSYNKVADVLVALGQLPEALTAYRDSLAIFECLAKADPGNTGWRRDLSVAYEKVGDVLVDHGQLSEALITYRDSLAIAGRLAKADPGNAGWQRDLSVSYNKVADVLVALGQLPEALTAYRDSLAIFECLAKAAPGNTGWRRDLSVAYEKVGDVLVDHGQLSEALITYRDSLAIAGRLAKADPGNAGWQRDLSVSYNKVADVLVALGQLPEALTAYRDSLAIFECLAKAAPGNTGWRRDLSVAYEKVGDVLVDHGQLSEALITYRDSLAIAGRLAKADPGNAGWQRDLSVSYEKVGDVLVAQGRLPEALAAYRDSLAIRERLAKADPGNAGWQRDLSVSYIKVADVLVDQDQLPEALTAYRDSLAIFERLAKADPGNAGWQRDLSVSYEKVANVLVAQDQLPEALTAYRNSLAIGERLAKADPGNAGWQRHLAVSNERVGDMHLRQGNQPEAQKAFRDSLAIRERLAKADPGNARWQVDLAKGHQWLAHGYRQAGDRDKAAAALSEGKAIMERMTKISPDNVQWRNDLAWFEGHIAALEG